MKKIMYPNLLGEMAKRGDTQRSLAKEIGLTYTAVWRRISGRQDWSINEIDKICKYYNKSFEELFKRGE